MANPPYQDWSKYVVPSGDIVVTDSNGPLNLYTGPIVDCSAWSQVMVVLHNTDPVSHFRCDLTWQNYNHTLLAQNPNYFVAGPGDFVQMVLPVKGRAVGMEYIFLDTAPTFGLAYAVLGLREPITRYGAAIFTTALLSTAVVIPGPGNTIIPMNYWYEGVVEMSAVSASGVASNVNMEYYDWITASWLEFLHIGIEADTQAVPRTIHFPPAPVRAHVYNQGSSSDTFRLNFTPRPE